MKISKSVRDVYAALDEVYRPLSAVVGELLVQKKEPRWHFEGRLKSLLSFAMKLETGRVDNPMKPDDFYACTLVVEGPSRIADAEKLVASCFGIANTKPPDREVTHLPPHSFEFDDLRIYARWRDDPKLRPTVYNGLMFEVQVKTFLQHAWTIATHDSLYKSDRIDWSASRIAFQVKAMLENAEVAIGASQQLGDAFPLARSDKRFKALSDTVTAIETRWTAVQLPQDRRTLAQNIIDLGQALRIELSELWACLDEATAAGQGTATLDLSPHAATVAALVRKKGPSTFAALGHKNCRSRVFVPAEVELPQLTPAILSRVVRT